MKLYSLISHLNVGSSGWDFTVPIEHQWSILLSYLEDLYYLLSYMHYLSGRPLLAYNLSIVWYKGHQPGAYVTHIHFFSIKFLLCVRTNNSVTRKQIGQNLTNYFHFYLWTSSGRKSKYSKYWKAGNKFTIHFTLQCFCKGANLWNFISSQTGFWKIALTADRQVLLVLVITTESPSVFFFLQSV